MKSNFFTKLKAATVPVLKKMVTNLWTLIFLAILILAIVIDWSFESGAQGGITFFACILFWFRFDATKVIIFLKSKGYKWTLGGIVKMIDKFVLSPPGEKEDI